MRVFFANFLAFERFFEHLIRRRFIRYGIYAFYGNIACPRANLDKFVKAHFKRGFKRVDIFNFSRECFELLNKALIAFCVDIHNLICAERRDHLEFIILFLNFHKRRKIVENFVRREHARNVRTLDQALRRYVVFFNIRVTFVPNRFSVFLVDFFRAIKKFFKLHLRPMIQGITERRTEYATIGYEFFLIRRRFARDIFFVDAVVSHQTPFVMIARKPNFKHVVKRFVFQNLLFR